MKIATKYHSTVEVKEQDIIHFASGIPGFPEEKSFVILPLEDTGLSVMQSAGSREVAFIVTDPFLFFPEYDFKLEEHVVEQLELESVENVSVYTILTISEPFEKTTANLQAPVIINTKNRKAKQVILSGSGYETRHPLINQKVKG